MPKPAAPPRPLERLAYTPEEVAETFGVSKRTVYNWIQASHLHAVRIGERRLLVPIGALRGLLERPPEQV